MEKVNKNHEENALKRDKAIQGLAAALHKREKEVGGRFCAFFSIDWCCECEGMVSIMTDINGVFSFKI